MKPTKVKVGITELRKTEKFENKRFEVEVEGELYEGEDYLAVVEKLKKDLEEKLNKFFEVDEPTLLRRKLKRYEEEYGKL